MDLQLMDSVKRNKHLQAEINLMQQNGIYIPKKYDQIDQALGEYINKFPEREQMKIMFLRESEGVYQFGSKKIHIKIQKGNQILCRVGGGYITIDEFLRTYTAQEVAKLNDKKSKIGTFHDKIAV